MSTGAPLIGMIVWNRLTGNTDTDAQVAQAAKFNEIVTTLGPFFIKLGQASQRVS